MIKAIIFDWNRTLWDKENGALFAETKDILEHYKQKTRLALASNLEGGNREEKLDLISKHNLSHYFDLAEFQEEKKDQIFEKIIQHWGLKPEEVAIVDDKAKKIVSFGRRTGATTIWLKKGKYAGELPDDDPDHVIYSLAELKRIV